MSIDLGPSKATTEQSRQKLQVIKLKAYAELHLPRDTVSRVKYSHDFSAIQTSGLFLEQKEHERTEVRFSNADVVTNIHSNILKKQIKFCFQKLL